MKISFHAVRSMQWLYGEGEGVGAKRYDKIMPVISLRSTYDANFCMFVQSPHVDPPYHSTTSYDLRSIYDFVIVCRAFYIFK